MSRNLVFAPDEYYHLYNRGTEKRKIFLDRADWDRFVKLLYLCNASESVQISADRFTYAECFAHERGEPLIAIGAYCLMPNHFHLLVREIEEGGISKFMQKLLTAYTMYFNTKYQRSGALFQGKFKAMHVASDRHLKYLYTYIHLNPVTRIDPKWKERGATDRRKAKAYLADYKHSSYADYMGTKRVEGKVLSRDTFPGYFSGNDFSWMIDEWLGGREAYEMHEVRPRA